MAVTAAISRVALVKCCNQQFTRQVGSGTPNPVCNPFTVGNAQVLHGLSPAAVPDHPILCSDGYRPRRDVRHHRATNVHRGNVDGDRYPQGANVSKAGTTILHNNTSIDHGLVESEVEMLKSENVSLAVIKRFNLVDDPEFTGRIGSIFPKTTLRRSPIYLSRHRPNPNTNVRGAPRRCSQIG